MTNSQKSEQDQANHGRVYFDGSSTSKPSCIRFVPSVVETSILRSESFSSLSFAEKKVVAAEFIQRIEQDSENVNICWNF